MTTQPSTRSARWLDDDPVTGNGWLRITTQTQAGPVVQEYEVEQVKSDLYRLWRLDPRTYELVCYEVKVGRAAALSTCTCPDAMHRRGGYGCKHAAGLWAALDALPF